MLGILCSDGSEEGTIEHPRRGSEANSNCKSNQIATGFAGTVFDDPGDAFSGSKASLRRLHLRCTDRDAAVRMAASYRNVEFKARVKASWAEFVPDRLLNRDAPGINLLGKVSMSSCLNACWSRSCRTFSFDRYSGACLLAQKEIGNDETIVKKSGYGAILGRRLDFGKTFPLRPEDDGYEALLCIRAVNAAVNDNKYLPEAPPSKVTIEDLICKGARDAMARMECFEVEVRKNSGSALRLFEAREACGAT